MSSPDDVILSQLQDISQLFSSYPPSEEFFQVSGLAIQAKNGRGRKECLFGQTWVEIPRRCMSRHLQG